MKITKLALLMTLLMGAGSSYAAFVDNRKTDAVIEVNYKSISVEDLVADIVPQGVSVDYANQDLRKKLVSVVGKGNWSDLLAQSAAGAQVRIIVDTAAQRVTVTERTITAQRTPAAKGAAGAGAAGLGIAAATSPAAPASFVTTSSDYQVSAVLQRWATQANMQYVWEPRDVEFQISAENDWGTDMRVAVRDLLTSVQTSQTNQAGRARVRACIHPNKPKNVLRIIKFDERCKGNI